MPELPDVAVFKNYCHRHILDRKIARVTARNNRVMKSSPATLRKHLEGRAFKQTTRHGKYLFLATDTRELVLHFGMTGSVLYMEDLQDIEHAPLILDFDDGTRFAFISVRKLGKVLLIDDQKKFIEKNRLGPDAYEIDKALFQKAVEKGGSIKSRLMNQKKLAGIGNIYSDEILYQSGIHPEKKEVTQEEIDTLFTTMNRIFDVCIRHKADPDEFPSRYLTKRREQGQPCGICDGRISKEKISGRSCYFCNQHQK
ncbi:MAG: DNA-formamidopyrimidine glycosylase family protein [Desulfotignum sp.]